MLRKPTQKQKPTQLNRHSLFVSPDSDQHADTQDQYRLLLTAAFEDALRTTLSDDMTLDKFSYETTHVSSDPCNQFHCVISNQKNGVILDQHYSILKLNSIENLVLALKSDCPTLTLTAHDVRHRLNQANVLLSPLDPGTGKAVYISGADPIFGEWQTATRLHYNITQKAWRLTLPSGISHADFKFLTGDYHLGKTTSTDKLHWEGGDNRQLADTQMTPIATILRLK